jgi:TnpA family transposase
VNWYFSPEATQAANDKVLHLMDRMELPNRYRRSQEVLHTSSDGQKFEVKVESLNANHSFKYFGKGKGVSVYSFIDERHLLFHWFRLTNHMVGGAGGLRFDGWLFPGEPRRGR